LSIHFFKKQNKKMNKRKPLLIGIAGSIILFIIYFGVISISNSFSHAVERFIEMWYLILILVAGFGFQVGLYSFIKISMSEKTAIATTEVAAAGGISTGSMIACCAHHITDILPIIGLSGAALFLVQYQIPFILLGIFSNLVGIAMMLVIIQEHKLFNGKKAWSKIFKYNLKTIRNAAIILLIIIVSASFVMTMTNNADSSADLNLEKEKPAIVLPLKINDENSVSVEVNPVNFSFYEQVKFYIVINTHQGSLDFDIREISVLEDKEGNTYKPVSWEGSPSGGHHMSGFLTFSKLNGETDYIKLTVKDIYDVPERAFVWDLNE